VGQSKETRKVIKKHPSKLIPDGGVVMSVFRAPSPSKLLIGRKEKDGGVIKVRVN